LLFTKLKFPYLQAWLMTATETTPVRYKLYATPEEWEASDDNKQDATQVARQELERAHNAHRNATENRAVTHRKAFRQMSQLERNKTA
jgi:glucose-6-phosphate isomerase